MERGDSSPLLGTSEATPESSPVVGSLVEETWTYQRESNEGPQRIIKRLEHLYEERLHELEKFSLEKSRLKENLMCINI